MFIRLAVWVPTIHPCWSGSMPVLVEGAAEPVPSADVEVRDLLRVGHRFGYDASVAAPLERQLGHIAGVNEMTSSSALGSTSITLQFDLNRNIDGAARDVQAAINAARANLPANLPSNPTYRKVNPADAPILILALTSG